VTCFNIEQYLDNSRKIDLSEFDLSSARQYSLLADEVRCLKYMMDIESSTIVYLRGLLRTAIVDDPETVAFLSCWAYEEFFHGRTIREFLKASAVEVREDRYTVVKRNVRWREHLEEVGVFLLGHLAHHFQAAYLTWGAVQELTTLEGYGVLASRTSNPLLKAILMRIIKDERRHFSFYYNKARMGLAASRAQWLTTLLLKNFWTPVGSGVKNDSEVNWMVQFIFRDSGKDVARRIDSTIARLPGLAWFNLVSETARLTA